jgi:hypothetical protein
MKILIDKLAENKVDSFWYYGETIAEIELPNGHKLIAETQGAIEMRFEENGTKFVGDNAVTEALNLDWNDSDLHSLNDDDLFIFTNWFVVVEIDEYGELVSDDLAIADDYDDAIEYLQEVYIELENY